MTPKKVIDQRKADAKKGLGRYELLSVHPEDRPRIKAYADRLRKKRQGGKNG